MLYDLPRELAEEVLSRFPVTSLRAVRLTCKKWNTLTKDWTLTTAKNKQRNNEIHQVVMMLDYRVSLFNDNLLYPSIERVGRLISLNNDDRVDISNIFHCDGLLLCIIKNDISRVVVWNPCTGQTKWLQPRNSFSTRDIFALGYVKNTYSHKVLRFMYYNDHIMKCLVREFEIYNFNSNSWKVLDIKPDWYIKFITLACLSMATLTGLHMTRIQEDSLISYSVSILQRRFGSHLPLPFHPYWQDTAQHFVLHKVKIWISSKIEPNAVSWNELFLEVDMKPDLTGFQFSFGRCSFFVDEKKKVAVVIVKDIGRFNSTGNNTAYIIGKKSYFKKVDLGVCHLCCLMFQAMCKSSKLHHEPTRK